jgi:myo-inositol-1(or 4)-monophosphatase
MIDQVIEIVRESSNLLKNRNFSVQSKGLPSNNVTSVDLSVQKFLKTRLMTLIDNCGFIGEESESKDYEKPYLWVVDPIDGTANFIRDMGFSAISVGLIKDGRPIMGVVYNPYRDEMFYAEKGKGAFLNGEPIKVSDNDLQHSIFCTAMSLYNKDYAKPCLNIIEKVYEECEDIRRMGSAALELVSLAGGRVDLYFEIRVFPWDFAASEIIISEAGGYVGTIGFDETVFNRPIPLICANTKENYEYLRQIVLKEIPEIPYTE